MKKDYNNKDRKATEQLRQNNPQTVAVNIPLPLFEAITAAHGELETLCIQVGTQIVLSLLYEEGKQIAGEKHSKNPTREANWWGEQRGGIYIAGQRVSIMRPRLRDKNGKEMPLDVYEKMQDPKLIESPLMRKLICGVSTRNYEEVVENFIEGTGKKKSSVSRHFVKATAKKLQEFLDRDLSHLDTLVIYIDGVEFQGHLLIVALGITKDGRKHVLGFRQGATENHTVCDALLEDLIRRGLNERQDYLFVIDGSKALRKSIKKTFGEEVAIQRCQQHKRRNVLGHLPEELHRDIDNRLKDAYNAKSYKEAKQSLELTARYIERINPDAAASLREGLEETLTVLKLNVSLALLKTLASTNPIESTFSHVRALTARVKNWSSADMVRRWTAVSFLRAETKFHRVKGYADLEKLVIALKEKSLVNQEVAA